MDPQSLVIVFRMAERILGVGIGAMLIYFGYRLFLDVRGKKEGSGDFSFVGGNKIKLSKVGPGVFFALFGAGLVLMSLFRPVSITTSNEEGAPKGAQASVKFMGASDLPAVGEHRVRGRAEAGKSIAALNKVAGQLQPGTNAQDREEILPALAAAKLSLMEPLWDEDWGDLADFRDWLEKQGAAPAGSEKAVEFFQQK